MKHKFFIACWILVLSICLCSCASKPQKPVEQISETESQTESEPESITESEAKKLVKEEIPLFQNIKLTKPTESFDVLDVSESAYLTVVHEIHAANGESDEQRTATSTVYLISKDDCSVQNKWDLYEDGMLCIDGVLTDSGIVLCCRQTVMQDTGRKYEIRLYSPETNKYAVLKEGECTELGKMARLADNRILYSVYAEDVLDLICMENEEVVYEKPFELPKNAVLDDSVSVSDGEYVFTVNLAGGRDNVFLYGSADREPEPLVLSESGYTPLECVLLDGRLLTMRTEQALTGRISSHFALFDTNGKLLDKTVFGADEARAQGTSYLVACKGFAVTLRSRGTDDGGVYTTLPIQIQNDKIVFMERPGDNAAYKKYIADGESMISYSVASVGGLSAVRFSP